MSVQKIRERSTGHAEHIHSNCDCEYAVRFDERSGVAGYNPEKYAEMYYAADGNNPTERINAMRREQYAKNKEEINAQKRIAYDVRKNLNKDNGGGITNSPNGREMPEITRKRRRKT